MALVENVGIKRRTSDLMRAKRARVRVDARPKQTRFHGAKIMQGQTELVIPEPLVEELVAQADEPGFDDSLARKRYDEQVEAWLDKNPSQTIDECTVSFVKIYRDIYGHEPKRFRSVEVLEDGISPEMSEEEKTALIFAEEMAKASTAQASRKGGRKSTATD